MNNKTDGTNKKYIPGCLRLNHTIPVITLNVSEIKNPAKGQKSSHWVEKQGLLHTTGKKNILSIKTQTD